MFNLFNKKQHIHIIGIAGTFMTGIAVLAKQMGYHVTGIDEQCYPPMSDILKSQGIDIQLGYHQSLLNQNNVDLYLIGNALSRGNPLVEQILAAKLPFTSGAAWLQETVLRNKHVLAVSGTHGKTTTASMVTWILDYAGKKPGFLIGGALPNFDCSARLSPSDYFVIEADEYDTAFFDKQPKFMHYWPSTLIINNLEFDHADIYSNLEAIQKQFSYLLRLVPQQGLIVVPHDSDSVNQVLSNGHWCKQENFQLTHGDWYAQEYNEDHSEFDVVYKGKRQGRVGWSLIGRHNLENGLAAIAASHHVGVDIACACQALAHFKPPKRRLEKKLEHDNVIIYDDFAHHPTAIQATLATLRAKHGCEKRLLCVLELGSYTMKNDFHLHALPKAIQLANKIYLYSEQETDLLTHMSASEQQRINTFKHTDTILSHLLTDIQSNDVIVLMSNRSLGGLSTQLVDAVSERKW